MTAVDRPDNGQDEGREVVHACPESTSGVTGCCGRTPFELNRWSRMTLDPSLVTCGRAGAGEQQRERVAAELARHQHLMGRRDDDQPQWFSWCECGWDGGPVEASRGAPADVRAAYRLHVADELLALLGGPQPDGEARQHRMNADCWCGPVQAANGAWDHR